eukprot:4690889-Pleurochrysis_carterae.AAC.3
MEQLAVPFRWALQGWLDSMWMVHPPKRLPKRTLRLSGPRVFSNASFAHTTCGAVAPMERAPQTRQRQHAHGSSPSCFLDCIASQSLPDPLGQCSDGSKRQSADPHLTVSLQLTSNRDLWSLSCGFAAACVRDQGAGPGRGGSPGLHQADLRPVRHGRFGHHVRLRDQAHADAARPGSDAQCAKGEGRRHRHAHLRTRTLARACAARARITAFRRRRTPPRVGSRVLGRVFLSPGRLYESNSIPQRVLKSSAECSCRIGFYVSGRRCALRRGRAAPCGRQPGRHRHFRRVYCLLQQHADLLEAEARLREPIRARGQQVSRGVHRGEERQALPPTGAAGVLLVTRCAFNVLSARARGLRSRLRLKASLNAIG